MTPVDSGGLSWSALLTGQRPAQPATSSPKPQVNVVDVSWSALLDENAGRTATTSVGARTSAEGAPVVPWPTLLGHEGELLSFRTPTGPVFRGDRTGLVDPARRTFVRVLGRRDRAFVKLMTLAWLVAFASFWLWLVSPGHRVTWVWLLVNGSLLLYRSTASWPFLASVNRLWQVNPRLPVPPLRAAFAVTKAPSEPWSMARTTLEAMRAQQYPYRYDVWLCDEDPTEETLRWCRAHGVHVSTRRGVEEYHRATWPRRTKCKEGNLTYFYDNWGYQHYDVVAQFDCDHVPEPSYLAEIMRPFGDPAVGYVAAPSVCDTNGPQSWSARGRLYREASFHGPVQLSHQRLGPVCIGSHYAVRTSALEAIGGIGPELAEDFSTAFLMTSGGWQGAFAHRAEAHGEGPHTLAAMLTQEFQWSRSIVMLLLDLAPRHLARLPWRLRVRFVYSLLYYPLLILSTVLGTLILPFAAVTGALWVDLNYLEYLLRVFAITCCILPLTALMRRRGLLRPEYAPVVSWEPLLYGLVQWPYIARGVLAAVRQRFRPTAVGFKVTPKARGGLEPLPTSLVVPYLAVSALYSAGALLAEFRGAAGGYVFLCLIGALAYALVTIAVGWLHAAEAARDAREPLGRSLAVTAAVPIGLGLVALCIALAAWAGFQPA